MNIPQSVPRPTPKQIARFWSRVKIAGPDECWPWLGAAQDRGYGVVSLRYEGKRRTFRTNRLAYLLHYGIDPGDHMVCHSCDNPPCVNPAHLWLGSAADNVRDKMVKGRTTRGETHHLAKLTAGDVLAIRSARGNGTRGTDLARQFGVTPGLICSIVKRRIWCHI